MSDMNIRSSELGRLLDSNKQVVETLRKFGDFDDGVLFYNGIAAPGLQQLYDRSLAIILIYEEKK